MVDQRTLVTQTLITSSEESARTIDVLLPLVYDELRSMAQRHLHKERARTLKTTALVHEAYLRLVDEDQISSKGRPYFFAAAARAMRRILIDRARKRKSQKRGAGEAHVLLDDVQIKVDAFAGDLLDLDDALNELAKRNERQSHVVECRYFGGMTIEETAAALNISVRSVHNDWAFARAWLLNRLDEKDFDEKNLADSDGI